MANLVSRSFKRAALAGLVVGAFIGSQAIAQAPAAAGAKTLKMQSTWPASLTLQDNFRFFAERVDKLTSSQLKIDALAAGHGAPDHHDSSTTTRVGASFRSVHPICLRGVCAVAPTASHHPSRVGRRIPMTMPVARAL